ncbi:MAG TPA: nucleotidyltransferase domain-containing protein [Sulfuricurvum sp.]|nr:nucleotidyltransferase domain-containing protein [Sulfuricurvum sp.]
MRLSKEEIEAIRRSFSETFQNGVLYLFGSRVDDARKGGDIDLYIVPESHSDLAVKKIAFLVNLKKRIGEQKIDVVIDRHKNRPIDSVAKQEGILLWSA